MSSLTKNVLMAAGLAAMPTLANAQVPARPQAAAAAPSPGAADRPLGDLPGPIDTLTDLQDSGRMMFKMADTNNDGQISQKEATDVGNLVLGGFFFRADANGDGTVSQDEAKQAQEALYSQKPLLRYLAQKGQRHAKAEGNTAAVNLAKMIGGILDTNDDKQLQASEVREAVKTGVQAMFSMADTNRDDQLSTTELNSAILGVARAAAQSAFDEADGDNDGAISRAEFDKAITEPANMIFAILDIDGDGKLTSQEAQRAQQVVGSQIRMLMVPEPANSARNLIRTGAKPEQIAPVPNPARR